MRKVSDGFSEFEKVIGIVVILVGIASAAIWWAAGVADAGEDNAEAIEAAEKERAELYEDLKVTSEIVGGLTALHQLPVKGNHLVDDLQLLAEDELLVFLPEIPPPLDHPGNDGILFHQQRVEPDQVEPDLKIQEILGGEKAGRPFQIVLPGPQAPFLFSYVYFIF